MRVHVADHPLIAHKITLLRDQNTVSSVFRDLADRQCFVLDPMLATGGSLNGTLDYLFDRGVSQVIAICLIGAPEGVAAVEKAMEGRDVTLVLGSLDTKLNEFGYIVPGLGDAGDRLYGGV